ncbi:MAG TPA: oligosaccharide flippase family protein, partial [Bacteroidales bacterium]|nr:oligosaccharide flippase family protein [Bacteroidales bacterium]
MNKDILRYTSATQLANLTQLGSRRISFYFINGFLGSAALGIYNAAIQLTEGIRMITQSIALVQFGHIANDHNVENNVQYTRKMLWISGILTFIALFMLLVIPEEWFLII